jgi:hypothetical protein
VLLVLLVLTGRLVVADVQGSSSRQWMEKTD